MRIFLTQSTRPVKTRYIDYAHDLPEYPQTHPDGYTYVIHVPDKSKITVDRTINSISIYKIFVK